MRGARITAVAGERPRRNLANHEMPSIPGTDEEWIRTRTGILSRGIAEPDETLLQLCTGAAGKAIAASGVAPDQIGLTIVTTITNPVPTPGISPQLTHQLGITSGAFDLNAACAGFCYSLSLAADTVRAGTADHVLVVGGERLTDLMDPADRNTCYIFADGAGAVIVSATDSPDDSGIGPVVWGTDGSRADTIGVPPGGKYVHMDGPNVFKWAISEVTAVAKEACAKAGIEPSELDAFVPHQANLRIVDTVARNLRLPESTVIADDIKTTGNTSSASIPLALSRLKEQGRVKTGDKALLIGFGAGMCWAGQVVECP